MKKWLPYLLAAAVGIGVAVLMFLPEEAPVGSGKVSTEAPAAQPGAGEAPMADLAPSDPSSYRPDRPPPPGTIRPMNEAEVRQQTREARPFNAHTNRVQTWWQLASRELYSNNPELATEARDMMTFVREQSRLDDGDVDIAAVVAKELALERKIRESGAVGTRLGLILDYINSSANTVIQGGDPAAIPRPELPPE